MMIILSLELPWPLSQSQMVEKISSQATESRWSCFRRKPWEELNSSQTNLLLQASKRRQRQPLLLLPLQNPRSPLTIPTWNRGLSGLSHPSQLRLTANLNQRLTNSFLITKTGPCCLCVNQIKPQVRFSILLFKPHDQSKKIIKGWTEQKVKC